MPGSPQAQLQLQQQEEIVPVDTSTHYRSQQAWVQDGKGAKVVMAAASAAPIVTAVAADASDHLHVGHDEWPVHPEALVSYATSSSDGRTICLKPPSPACKAAMSVPTATKRSSPSTVESAVEKRSPAAVELASTTMGAPASSSTAAAATVLPPTSPLLHVPRRYSSPRPKTRTTTVTTAASSLRETPAAITAHAPTAAGGGLHNSPPRPYRATNSGFERSRTHERNVAVGDQDVGGFDGLPPAAAHAFLSEGAPISPIGDMAGDTDEDMTDVIQAIGRVFGIEKTGTRDEPQNTTMTTIMTTMAEGGSGLTVGGDVRGVRDHQPPRKESFAVTADRGHGESAAPPSLALVPSPVEPDWCMFTRVSSALRALGVPTDSDSTDESVEVEEEAEDGKSVEKKEREDAEKEEGEEEEEKNEEIPGSLGVPRSPTVFENKDLSREKRPTFEICSVLCCTAPLVSPTFAANELVREAAAAVPVKARHSSAAKESVTVEADAEGSARRTASAYDGPAPTAAGDPSLASGNTVDTMVSKTALAIASKRRIHTRSASFTTLAEEYTTPAMEGEYATRAGARAAGAPSQDSASAFAGRRSGVEKGAVLGVVNQDPSHVAATSADERASAGPVTSIWLTHGTPIVSCVACTAADMEGEEPGLTQSSTSRRQAHKTASKFGGLLQTFFFGSPLKKQPRSKAFTSADDQPPVLAAPGQGSDRKEPAAFAGEGEHVDDVFNTAHVSNADDHLSMPRGSDDAVPAPLCLTNPTSSMTDIGAVVEKVDQEAAAAVEEVVVQQLFEEDVCALYQLPSPVGSEEVMPTPASPETKAEQDAPVVATQETSGTPDEIEGCSKSDGVFLALTEDIQRGPSHSASIISASTTVDGLLTTDVAAPVVATIAAVDSVGGDTKEATLDSLGAAAHQLASDKVEDELPATAEDGWAEQRSTAARGTQEREEAFEVPAVPNTECGADATESVEDPAAAGPMFSGSAIPPAADPVVNEAEHIGAAVKNAVIDPVVDDIDGAPYEGCKVRPVESALFTVSVETQAEQSIPVLVAEEVSQNKGESESEGLLPAPARRLSPSQGCSWPSAVTVKDSTLDTTVGNDAAITPSQLSSAINMDGTDAPLVSNPLLDETSHPGAKEALLQNADEKAVLASQEDPVKELGGVTAGESFIASYPETESEHPASADTAQGPEGPKSSLSETVLQKVVTLEAPETTACAEEAVADASPAASIVGGEYEFLTARVTGELPAESAGDTMGNSMADEAAAEGAPLDSSSQVEGEGEQASTFVGEAAIKAGTEPVLQGADGTFAETAGGISAAVASVGAWAAEVAELVKGKISWEGSVAKIIDSASIGRDARLQQTSEENIAGMGKDLLSSLEVPVVGKDGAAERYEDAPTVVPVVGNGGSAFSVDLTTVDGTAVECTQGLETVGDDLSAPGNAGASSNSEEVIPRVLAGETFDEPRAEGDVAGEQSACNVIVTAPDVKVEGDVARPSAGLTGSDSAALSAPDLNIGMTGVESDTEDGKGRSISTTIEVAGVAQGGGQLREIELGEAERVAQDSAPYSAEATLLAGTEASRVHELAVVPGTVVDAAAPAMDGDPLVEVPERIPVPSVVEEDLYMPLPVVDYSSPVYGFDGSVILSEEISDRELVQAMETSFKREPEERMPVISVAAGRGDPPLPLEEGMLKFITEGNEDEGLLQAPVAGDVDRAPRSVENAPAATAPSVAELNSDVAIEAPAVAAVIEDAAAVFEENSVLEALVEHVGGEVPEEPATEVNLLAEVKAQPCVPVAVDQDPEHAGGVPRTAEPIETASVATDEALVGTTGGKVIDVFEQAGAADDAPVIAGSSACAQASTHKDAPLFLLEEVPSASSPGGSSLADSATTSCGRGDGVMQNEDAGCDQTRVEEEIWGSAAAPSVYDLVARAKGFRSTDDDGEFDGSPTLDFLGLVAQIVYDTLEPAPDAVNLVQDQLTTKDANKSLPETGVGVGEAGQPGAAIEEARFPDLTEPPASEVTVDTSSSLKYAASVVSGALQPSSEMASEVSEVERLEQAAGAVDDAPKEEAVFLAEVTSTPAILHASREEDVSQPQNVDGFAQAYAIDPILNPTDGAVMGGDGPTTAEGAADKGGPERVPSDDEERFVVANKKPGEITSPASASGKAGQLMQSSERVLLELDERMDELANESVAEDVVKSDTAIEIVLLPTDAVTTLAALLKRDFIAGAHEELSAQVLSLIFPSADTEELLPNATVETPEVDSASGDKETGPVDDPVLSEDIAAGAAPDVLDFLSNITGPLPTIAETGGVKELGKPDPTGDAPSKDIPAQDGHGESIPSFIAAADVAQGEEQLPSTRDEEAEAKLQELAPYAVERSTPAGIEDVGDALTEKPGVAAVEDTPSGSVLEIQTAPSEDTVGDVADVYGDLPVCGMGVAAPDAFVAGYEASGSAGTAARSLATSSTIGASVNLSDDHDIADESIPTIPGAPDVAQDRESFQAKAVDEAETNAQELATRPVKTPQPAETDAYDTIEVTVLAETVVDTGAPVVSGEPILQSVAPAPSSIVIDESTPRSLCVECSATMDDLNVFLMPIPELADGERERVAAAEGEGESQDGVSVTSDVGESSIALLRPEGGAVSPYAGENVDDGLSRVPVEDDVPATTTAYEIPIDVIRETGATAVLVLPAEEGPKEQGCALRHTGLVEGTRAKTIEAVPETFSQGAAPLADQSNAAGDAPVLLGSTESVRVLEPVGNPIAALHKDPSVPALNEPWLSSLGAPLPADPVGTSKGGNTSLGGVVVQVDTPEPSKEGMAAEVLAAPEAASEVASELPKTGRMEDVGAVTESCTDAEPPLQDIGGLVTEQPADVTAEGTPVDDVPEAQIGPSALLAGMALDISSRLLSGEMDATTSEGKGDDSGFPLAVTLAAGVAEVEEDSLLAMEVDESEAARELNPEETPPAGTERGLVEDSNSAGNMTLDTAETVLFANQARQVDQETSGAVVAEESAPAPEPEPEIRYHSFNGE